MGRMERYRLLVIGGSGLVGGMVVPVLARRHPVRVFDLRPPALIAGVDYHPGDVTDFAALRAAMAGIDVLVYLAMNPKAPVRAPATVAAAFDVNVKGVHLALWAAHLAGVRHAVHASSLSVFRTRNARFPDDTATPDARQYYGFTKRLGEEVCRNAVTHWGLTVTALRLCFPVPDAQWPPTTGTARDRAIATRGSAVAAAVEAALAHRDGFQAITISGDQAGRFSSPHRARQLLGWPPA